MFTHRHTHTYTVHVCTPMCTEPSHKSIRRHCAELYARALLAHTPAGVHTLTLHARTSTSMCAHSIHTLHTHIHRRRAHIHGCACTRALPHMYTHTFTCTPTRALAGLAPPRAANGPGRAGGSRACSPRAAPAPVPWVRRAPEPLTSTWCAGSGTRSSPGRPSS